MTLLLWIFMILGVVSAHQEQFVLKEPSFSYELCDTYQAFKIKSIELNPPAPIKGEKLTVNINGYLEKEVNEGSQLKMFLKFMKIGLLRKTFDVCDELDNTEDAPMKCPIEVGDKSWSYGFDIPSSMPSGDYEVHTNITDVKSDLLLCAKVYFTL